jgi:hypothetical protein
MDLFNQFLLPNPQAFCEDPFGYSSLAWTKWAIAQNMAGIDIDPEIPPTSQDLKSPILWLSQAHALSEAAAIVLRGTPNLDSMPLTTRGMCDSQFRAVGMMLVGYSLEIALKGMLIIRKGVDTYAEDEKMHRHHKLVKLADFIPDLTEKDKAILDLLTRFLEWAGRYPDPGSGREASAEGIFGISEKYQIAAKDVFGLAARVMGHAKTITANLD